MYYDIAAFLFLRGQAPALKGAMADAVGYCGREEGWTHARMHAPMQRYTFQDTLIEHMVQANNGEAAATAECIKHFPPPTDTNCAETKI